METNLSFRTRYSYVEMTGRTLAQVLVRKISYQRSVDAPSASPARQGEVFALDRESYIELHAKHGWSQAKNQRLQKVRKEWEGAVVEV